VKAAAGKSVGFSWAVMVKAVIGDSQERAPRSVSLLNGRDSLQQQQQPVITRSPLALGLE
jgi:hypothetical protein